MQSQFRGRFRRLWCRSQVRFNRVPEKVPEKVPASLGAKASQVHWVPEKVPEKIAEKVPEKVAEKKHVKIKRCGCWGYHQSSFFIFGVHLE